MMDFRTFVDNAEGEDRKQSMHSVSGKTAESPPVRGSSSAAPSMWSSVDPAQENRASTKQPKPLPKPKVGSLPQRSTEVKKSTAESPDVTSDQMIFPIGWLVVVAGPGLGAFLTLREGISRICRNSEGTIFLAPDESVSPFVTIIFEAARKRFTVCKGTDVASVGDLSDGDTLSIGRTKIRFVAFCDESFQWGQPAEESK